MKLPRRPYLTTRAHEAFSLAFDLAAEHGYDDVTPLHVTLGLLREGHGVAVGMLHQRGVPLDALARDLEAALPAPRAPRPAVSTYAWSAEADRLVAAAQHEAQRLGIAHYGAEHLLLAVLRDGTSAPAVVLARYGIGATEIEADLRVFLGKEIR